MVNLALSLMQIFCIILESLSNIEPEYDYTFAYLTNLDQNWNFKNDITL